MLLPSQCCGGGARFRSSSSLPLPTTAALTRQARDRF